MKKIIFAAVILGLLFSGLWYYGATHAKNYLLEKVAHFEATAKDEGYLVTHEGISVRGFPFHYEAAIKSPKIVKDPENKTLGGNLEEANLDGDIILGSNLLGTHFSIQKVGNSHITLKGSDKASSVNQYVISGTSAVSFSVKENSYLESIKNPFQALFKMIEKDEGLLGNEGSINLDHFKLVDVQNPNVSLFEVEKGNISYQVKETSGKAVGFVMSGDIKGLDLDTYIMGSDAYMPGRERSLKEIALLMSMPKPGKTALSFDMEVTAPFDEFEKINEQTTFADFPAFKINLKNVDVTNNFGTYSHKGILSLQDTAAKGRQAHLDFLATANTSKEQFESFKTSWAEFLNNLPVCEESRDAKAKDACVMYKSIIPRMDEFGKITFQVDMDFNATNPQNLLDNSQIDVRHLDFFSDLYGMKSNGVGDYKLPEKISANYKFHLINYKSLFADMYNYSNRLHKIGALISPEMAAMPQLKESYVTLITDFLKNVSDEPSKDLKDIDITLKINGVEDIRIGTLTAEQFEQKLGALIAEIQKQFKPALVQKPKEVKPEEVKQQEVKPEEMKQEEIKQEEVKQEEMKQEVKQ